METKDFINSISKKTEDFKKRNINEAQTKEWLIKPFFETLGWSFSNPDEVIPEDDDSTGKRPDYGFYFNGKPKFYVEAKQLNNNLDDIKMITEKVNYCNNSDVPFLIITNGLNYKIYYIGLKGAGKDKLLQEFSIFEDYDDEIIEMLKKESFESNILLNYAQNVFIFTNVKTAIEKVFQKSPKKLIDLINEEIKDILGHKFGDDDISKSLKYFNMNINHEFTNETPESIQQIDNGNIKWTVEYQFKNGNWKNSLDLYRKLLQLLKNNGISIIENPTKFYIGLLNNDINYFQIHGQQSGLKVWINIPYNELTEQEKLKSRDVSSIGHWGMGNTECFVTNETDFDWITNIIKKAFDKTK